MAAKKSCSINCQYCNAELELTRREVTKDPDNENFKFNCHVCGKENRIKSEDLCPDFLLHIY